MKKIGIIGAGVMASGMTRNFLEHDIEVCIWNRTHSRVEPLAQYGATVCTSPKDVVSKSDIIIECVSDTPASRSVWLSDEGILAGADENKVLIITSTVSTAWIDELAETCEKRKLPFLDMPLTGGPKGAETGSLCLLVGGPDEVLNSIRQELDAISSHVFHFGRAGMGIRFKLIQNALSSIQINAAVQASKLAEKAGVEPSRFYEAMHVGNMAPASPITKSVLKDVASPPASVNFSIKMLEKDLRYAQELAKELGMPFDLLDDTLQDFVGSKENPAEKPELSNIINMYRKFDTN